MSDDGRDGRYCELLEAVKAIHGGTQDSLGRPRYDHFERVVKRLVSRNPDAPPEAIEAAILHDAITHPDGGNALLKKLNVRQRTIDILARLVPPPNADYYSQMDRFTPADNAVYLDYVRTLIASGDRAAIAVKLADVEDTVETLRALGNEVALRQLERQYDPSRRLLEQGLID